MSNQYHLNFIHLGFITSCELWHLTGKVPRKPRLVGGVKGHNKIIFHLLASRSPLRARETPPCGRGASHWFI
jgi:hypothetical protein